MLLNVMFVSCIECFFLERNGCVLNIKLAILYLIFCEIELNDNVYVCACMHVQDVNLN